MAKLHSMVRKKLTTLRQADWHRRKGREKATLHTAFTAKLSGVTRKIFVPKQISARSHTRTAYFNYSDATKEKAVKPCSSIITTPEAVSVFQIKEQRLKEIKEVIRVTRTSSAPGPSRVPYVVHMRSSSLVTQLITEERVGKGYLLCLYLANAYSSIPRKLVEMALNLHHVPVKIRDLILDY